MRDESGYDMSIQSIKKVRSNKRDKIPNMEQFCSTSTELCHL